MAPNRGKLMTKNSRLSYALLVLFVLSGFAGLIYQSVWSHYLGLTLGHAAYAQTLVLAIFMGGMAVGAWLASRYSIHWRRLILGYAVVEGLIGVLGLVFHPVFAAYTGFSQDTLLPLLPNVALAHAYQWLSAALLIAPQSVLLGATFPLMSAGLIRAMPNEHGEVLGGLYFSNSLGAALGALVATFVLLPAVGLPGTVFTAAVVNIAVGIGAWQIAKWLGPGDAPLVEAPKPDADGTPTTSDELKRLGRVLMWSTAVSGAASFVYEVGWVRLLNQALGTTIHSFELMLAAFILGLAFGGLWIRKRGRHIAEPVRYVGYVQVWMAVAALLSIPVFTQSFTWVSWMMGALSRSANGYLLYELGTALISLLVMFPAAFFAGMTLPLFTLALLRAGAGERAIGRIYAANTVGAIVGVALTMHALIPLMGVRLAVTAAAIVDGLVGLYLLRMINPARLSRPVAGAALAMSAAVVFGLMLGKPDPRSIAASVFRTGAAYNDDAEVKFIRDGKTATVAFYKTDKIFYTIATNSKPDASLTAPDTVPSDDEITMVMAGTLPLSLHPHPEKIAVIGWGSGLTTHTLMGSPVPKAVDTVEIEAAMVEGARLYGPWVGRAYSDPRSHIWIDDARTFFSTGARRYDVIVSEPSNPWVSGVASLFTQEFYAFLKRHLNQGGMVVQWLHMYEIDDPLFATMMAALVKEFPHTEIYLTNSADLLMVARTAPGAPLPATGLLSPEGSPLQIQQKRVGLDRWEQVALRRVGSGDVLRNYIRMTGVSPHSDYYPTVSLNAPRTRYMSARATFLESTLVSGMPLLDILDCRQPLGRGANLSFIRDSTLSLWQQTALALVDSMESGVVDTKLMKYAPSSFGSTQALLGNSRQLTRTPLLMPLWSDGVADLASRTLGHLPAEDLAGTWVTPVWLPADVAARPDVAAIMAAYSATARRAPGEMRARAEAVLALPPGEYSGKLREQMLSIAMLGALGTGDHAGAVALERKWGSQMPSTPSRQFILTWAQGNTPACMTRQ